MRGVESVMLRVVECLLIRRSTLFPVAEGEDGFTGVAGAERWVLDGLSTGEVGVGVEGCRLAPGGRSPVREEAASRTRLMRSPGRFAWRSSGCDLVGRGETRHDHLG
ncbi:MAG: hypothetical protein DYH08_06120 [Actinobacteria bacterium ATB1]|nr:hypothetical protein [Actinobacteria bacterium ATB1]